MTVNLPVPVGPLIDRLAVVAAHRLESTAEFGDGAELAAHFPDHRHGGAADGVDRHGAEDERQHGADEQAGHDVGVGNIDRGDTGRGHVRGEQRQRGQRRGADGKALADGGGGVTDGVEPVGAGADFRRQFAHLGDAAGVVGDGAVSVDRQLDAGVGQHADGGDCDTKQAGKLVRAEDGRCDENGRPKRGVHAVAEPGNDVRGCAGDRLFADGDDWFLVDAGVVFRDKADAQAAGQTKDACVKNAHRGVGVFSHCPLGREDACDGEKSATDHQHGSGQFAPRQSRFGIAAFFHRDNQCAEYRGDNADGSEHQRKQNHTHRAGTTR